MSKVADLSWETVDDVIIGYGTPGRVPDAIWNQWVEALKAPRVTRVINLSSGYTEVSSVQRAAASAVLKERNLTVAVVTDETLMRGMVTAVSWFVGNNIKAFSWRQIGDAIAFLGAKSIEDRIQAKVALLRAKHH